MLDNYDIEKLNPRKNPYAKKLKKQITINIDSSIIDYFKEQAQTTGIPYQTLINLYLIDCVEHKKKLNITWAWINIITQNSAEKDFTDNLSSTGLSVFAL